jgi:uncharacterized membrane protein
MGYILLLLGLAVWTGAHVFKRVAPDRRAAMGDAGKGLVAVLLLGSIVLMVIGYRSAGFVNVWFPPAFMVHIANLLGADRLLVLRAFDDPRHDVRPRPA